MSYAGLVDGGAGKMGREEEEKKMFGKDVVHPRSQSSRGKKGTTAMSWRQRKYQDNPLLNMGSSDYAGHSNRL